MELLTESWTTHDITDLSATELSVDDFLEWFGGRSCGSQGRFEAKHLVSHTEDALWSETSEDIIGVDVITRSFGGSRPQAPQWQSTD